MTKRWVWVSIMLEVLRIDHFDIVIFVLKRDVKSQLTAAYRVGQQDSCLVALSCLFQMTKGDLRH